MRLALMLVSCLAPALAWAGPVRIGADFGYTRLLRGGDLDGIGGNLYVGRPFESGLVLEGQVGLHHNWSESDDYDGRVYQLDLTSIPIMLGGRFLFDFGGALVPYVGAHTGVTVVRTTGAIGDRSSDPEMATDFTLKMGAGLDFDLDSAWVLGFGIWYWMVLAGETTTVAGVDITEAHDSLVTLALSVRFDL